MLTLKPVVDDFGIGKRRRELRDGGERQGEKEGETGERDRIPNKS